MTEPPERPRGCAPGGLMLAALALSAAVIGPAANARPLPERTEPAPATAYADPGAAAIASASSAADPVERWRPLIEEAARRFAIPADWIARVMRAESGGRTTLGGRPITSRAGAMGLMQLMPGTWAAMRARHGLGGDPHDPRDNILAGAGYLAAMHDRFGYPGLFGAYNAGPARYAEWLAGRRPLPAETRVYLARVAGGERVAAASGTAVPPPQEPAAAPVPPARSALFALERSDAEAAESSARPAVGTLFVALSRSASRAGGD